MNNKYDNKDVQNLFESHDLIVIMETHFVKRQKCPENFTLIAKSENLNNARRGGVAVYMKRSLDMRFHVYDNICPDAVVFSIKGTRSIFIAPYITPETSRYAIEGIFLQLKIIISNFKDYSIYLMGDLNARCGTLDNSNVQYAPNPDDAINSYGRKLVNLCDECQLTIVNGLKTRTKTFDSKFTFYRGKGRSQNDWFITNHVDSIEHFVIGQKLRESDHTPLSMTLLVRKEITLGMIEALCAGHFSYDIYDRSKQMKPKISLERINTQDLALKFNDISVTVNEMINNVPDVDIISDVLTNSIYTSCSDNSKRRPPRIPDDKRHLSSRNFQAIANMNLHMYNISILRNDTTENSMKFFDAWVCNHDYAVAKEKVEFNEKVNSSWRLMAKDDPKKLWKKINYKNEPENTTKNENINEKTIQTYFKGIFQAPKLDNNPTIEDVKDTLADYHVYIPLLDDDFSLNELNIAIQNNGRGIGLDSIDKRIANLFTMELRQCILRLFNLVFSTNYPNVWTKLLLRPEKKKGHTDEIPKLRGVAISQLLPTLYDIMIYNRFNQWYVPNCEQAGFRVLQGCILQIFAIYILMEAMKAEGKSIYVGFLDYEKAFDFINRANIIFHLMEHGAGARFTRAIANMYEETSYVPKVCNLIGDGIAAKHGVTQGRQSSTSIFSFEVSKLPNHVDVPQSSLRGFNCCQLADDTALPVEDRPGLITGFRKCFEFSEINYMFANIDKTVYLHLDDEPDTEPLIINEETTIGAAIDNEYVYLGMLFIASNDIVKHIESNLKQRAFHEAKFFEWLSVNEWTPIRIKVHVLYACMFNAYLYGAEAWWRIDDFSDNLLKLERKLLKAVLHANPSTPHDLVYIELSRPDIVAIVKQRQHSFFKRLNSLNSDDSICKKLVDRFRHLPVCSYYDQLNENSASENKTEKSQRCSRATGRYLSRYNSLIIPERNHVIYDNFMHENLRIVITRWRLSNHRLMVEMGRRHTPKMPRELRICSRCQVLEDEKHALFDCPLYHSTRRKYSAFLEKYSSVHVILNPEDVEDATVLGNYLIEIEKIRKNLNLE